MADSNFRGPVNSMGPLEDPAPIGPPGTISTVGWANNTLQIVTRPDPTDGPSILYQGVANPNILDVPYAKDQFRPGQQNAFLTINNFYAIDMVPQLNATNVLGTQQLMTINTNLTLVTAQAAGTAGAASVAVGVPIIPAGTSVATVAALAIDFGFATGTTTANSSTVTVNDNTQFTPGQWIIIGGAGNAAASLSHVCQVVTVATANITGITIAPAAVTAINNAPIGGANLYGGANLPAGGQLGGPNAPAATAWSPYVQAGHAAVWNPKEASGRCLTFTVGTTSATTAVTVYGWDVHGNPMAEKVTFISGNRSFSTFYGGKAFKFINYIANTTTAVGSTAVGLSDTFGFPLRVDHVAQYQAWWNGALLGSTSVGFTAAATTAPATNTSGDVRGTLQVSTVGTGTAAPSGAASTTTSVARLVVIQNQGLWNQVYANPNNPIPKFGIAQATA